MRSDHNANPFTIHFLQKLKRQGIKVIMEIPTYPYDQEYNGFSYKEQMELKIDQLFRRSLAKRLFRICTFSDYDFIFGAQTIKISNGIDFSTIPLKQTLRKHPFPFNLIGVAEVHYWHVGIKVKSSDPSEWIKAITYLYEHKEEARIMGENGKKLAREKYNIEICANEILDSINSLYK